MRVSTLLASTAAVLAAGAGSAAAQNSTDYVTGLLGALQ